MNFREHGIMLYLDKTLYTAFIKLQAEYGLGRSYAGLLPFVEGLYTMGFLSKEDYVRYRKKYSEKLVQKAEAKIPRCSFCAKMSIASFEDKTSGLRKFACDHHTGELKKHPKWTFLEAVSNG